MWPKDANSVTVQPYTAALPLPVESRTISKMKKPTPFGKYFLLERINVGGMAEVFRAKAFGVEGFERLVAVKRILPNIAEDKEFIRMFIEEAKLSVQLNHANIAQIFDLGVVDGAYYIALEHVHGRDLRGIFDRCRQVGEAMPVAQACFVSMKVCEGLDYAHNKRDQSGRELSLVHRDVSPQNVLVSFEGEVKLIDFGIAKAAGKGSKTQAGILKGKFGYMSPEQVRGLPVDRRSDVFSAGIVLYELLTGERLFVGESDFSTLEKVRNVEILPPSTYNRKIPDELERIVLKALAKDVEDRYQNAIDLHDELQAFVYTAGEFYSRKDLAGWMKKTFSKEIEDETAKLESYRQLKAPAPEALAAPAVARTGTGSRPPVNTPPPVRRSTAGMPATKPPPPPTRTSGPIPVVAAESSGRRGRKEDSGSDLAWDDDELETQIYDNPEDDPKNQGKRGGSKLPLAASPPTPMPAPGMSAGMSAADPSPDLSSLVSTSKGWEKGPTIQPISSPAATMNGIGAPPPPMNGGANGTHRSGPNKVVPVPLGGDPNINPLAATVASGGLPNSHALGITGSGPVPMLPDGPRESAVSQRLVSVPDSGPNLFDPMASFGSGITARKSDSKKVILIAAGAAVVVALGVVVVIMATGGKKETNQPATAQGDGNTGFDLYVTPGGVTKWKLDGEARTDKLPSRIRGITPGTHRVQIEAPAGYLSEEQTVTVALGKAEKVDITLKSLQINATFETTPSDANVSLIIESKRQTLGPSPVSAPLDVKGNYSVLFEKQGYVSVNRPIQLDAKAIADGKITISVNLESSGVAVADAGSGKTDPGTDPKTGTTDPKTGTTPAIVTDPKTTPKTTPKTGTDPKTTPKTGTDPKTTPKVGTGSDSTGPKTTPDPLPVGGDPIKKDPPVVAAKGTGTLTLGSKPPCDIFIDGSSTGQHTPQRDIKLSVGRHKITLINNEFGIKETFTVDIKADTAEKVIKDFSDRLPK